MLKININQNSEKMENLKLTLLSGASAGTIEVIDQASKIEPSQLTDSVGIISQIIILIATLFRIFGKKKDN